MSERLLRLVEAMDAWLDENCGQAYKDQPLAQDWARVAKGAEELGEAIDALIGITEQNPRKGMYGTRDDLLIELADQCLTGIYAIQHFTKDTDATWFIVTNRAEHHAARIGLSPAPKGADPS